MKKFAEAIDQSGELKDQKKPIEETSEEKTPDKALWGDKPTSEQIEDEIKKMEKWTMEIREKTEQYQADLPMALHEMSFDKIQEMRDKVTEEIKNIINSRLPLRKEEDIIGSNELKGRFVAADEELKVAKNNLRKIFNLFN